MFWTINSVCNFAFCELIFSNKKAPSKDGAFINQQLSQAAKCLTKFISFRKEVIQPQVPLRLPCYDLVPVIGLTVGRRFPALIFPAQPSFHNDD